MVVAVTTVRSCWRCWKELVPKMVGPMMMMIMKMTIKF